MALSLFRLLKAIMIAAIAIATRTTISFTITFTMNSPYMSSLGGGRNSVMHIGTALAMENYRIQMQSPRHMRSLSSSTSASSTPHSNNQPSSKALFYIYDWPDVVDKYATTSDRDTASHGVEFPAWTDHHGAGRQVNAQTMEHKTSQFALFKLLYERALIDPRRTMDPEKATSFLIPYDFGMDATFRSDNGRMRKTNCPRASLAMQLLSKSPHFKRNSGFDHTLIVSVNQNMNYFLGARNCTDFLLNCWNCTKLSIDEYMFIATDRAIELGSRGINWHAIPFPSDYHFSTSNSAPIPMWTRNMSRPVIVSFTGSSKRFNEYATAIREALVLQCGKHKPTCSHGTYKHEEGGNGLAQSSVFCLQPPGDMPTRKSLFDAILSGCLPVLFHPLTARFMYEWHLPQEIWDEIGIHYDSIDDYHNLISGKVDYIQKLEDLYLYSPNLVKKMQRRLRDIAYNIQYSLIEEDKAANSDKKSSIVASIPGHSDAYDISMNNVLRLHSGESSHDRRSEFISCKFMLGRQGVRIQTADFCNRTYSNVDPFYPPATISPFFKGRHAVIEYKS